MNKNSEVQFLQDAVRVLVSHFGAVRVRTALDQISPIDQAPPASPKDEDPKKTRVPRQKFSELLSELKVKDPDKYRILASFFEQLRTRKLLPEAEDIRHYVQIVGVKDIQGSSRKELVQSLMRSLAGFSIDKLQDGTRLAAGINKENRQKGYSELVDKLLRNS